MPKRRKATVTRAPASVSRPPASLRSDGGRSGAHATAIARWRRAVRPKALRSAASATEALGWSQNLLDLLFEELYVEDDLKVLIGRPVQRLRKGQYPQAIAIALLLRHSWRADDFRYMLQRLGLSSGKRSRGR